MAPLLTTARAMLRLPTMFTVRNFTSSALRRPVLPARQLGMGLGFGAIEGNGAGMVVGQVRGMKVRSSVKKMCEGCKVRTRFSLLWLGKMRR